MSTGVYVGGRSFADPTHLVKEHGGRVAGFVVAPHLALTQSLTKNKQTTAFSTTPDYRHRRLQFLSVRAKLFPPARMPTSTLSMPQCLL